MRRLRVAAAAGTAAALALLFMGGPAHAAGAPGASGPTLPPSWWVQSTSGADQAHLQAVSCTSASFCLAVGQSVEQWNGSTWSPLALILPRDATLSGVSCTSPRFCLAVGAEPTGEVDGYSALAFVWNGSGWVGASPPAVPGYASVDLASVSCPTSARCVATGYAAPRVSSRRVGNGLPLAEMWDGAGWTAQVLGTGTEGDLLGVSCPSSTWCMAVGSQAGPDLRTVALAVSWNGTLWAPTPPPAPGPAGDQLQLLRSVSCPSTSFCMAVGGGGGGVLNTEWNGSRWAGTGVPPAYRTAVAGAGVYLQSVSCLSGSSCTAVGSENGCDTCGGVPDRTSGSLSTAAEKWDGSSWATTVTQSPGSQNELFGVSCVDEDLCGAVGGQGGADTVLIESYGPLQVPQPR